jgi:hypothetical protein
VTCTTHRSCRFERAPIRIELTSPRTTAPGQMEAVVADLDVADHAGRRIDPDALAEAGELLEERSEGIRRSLGIAANPVPGFAAAPAVAGVD